MRYASAEVRKQFFIEMFTRDISLEDCVLDLIDNSLDSYLMKNSVSISDLVFGTRSDSPERRTGQIDVTCNEAEIKVVDTCGGISRDRAQNEVFCFGHEPDDPIGKLGAYGVGMKRALFKIGNTFHIVSRTASEGFEASFKLDEWGRSPHWKVPITFVAGAGSERKAGTSITVTDLHEEVKLRIKGGGVARKIVNDAAATYPYFLGKCVTLRINKAEVSPEPIRLGEIAGTLEPAHEKFEQENVRVTLVASVAPGQRKMEDAGWYVLCNGRVVVRADKSELTGWGTDLASFQPKYRSFVGVASFESTNPLDLPWTTTKRNLNQETKIFIRAKALMVTMSKPILTFLNSQYPSEATVEVADIRETVGGVRDVSFKEIAAKPVRGFAYNPPKKADKKHEWVRFQVEVRSLDAIRRHLKRPAMRAAEIAKFTISFFVKTECGE